MNKLVENYNNELANAVQTFETSVKKLKNKVIDYNSWSTEVKILDFDNDDYNLFEPFRSVKSLATELQEQLIGHTFDDVNNTSVVPTYDIEAKMLKLTIENYIIIGCTKIQPTWKVEVQNGPLVLFENMDDNDEITSLYPMSNQTLTIVIKMNV